MTKKARRNAYLNFKISNRDSLYKHVFVVFPISLIYACADIYEIQKKKLSIVF